MADIYVLIVEDEALGKRLATQYFGDGITFAALYKPESRGKIVRALDGVEE